MNEIFKLDPVFLYHLKSAVTVTLERRAVSSVSFSISRRLTVKQIRSHLFKDTMAAFREIERMLRSFNTDPHPSLRSPLILSFTLKQSLSRDDVENRGSLKFHRKQRCHRH